MIDWITTVLLCGAAKLIDLRLRKPIQVICDECKLATKKIKLRDKSKIIDGDYQWSCNKCVGRKLSPHLQEMSKNLWKDEDYRTKNLKAVRSIENRKLLSDNWHKHMPEIMSNVEYKEKQSQIVTELWKDEDYAAKITQSSLDMWNNVALASKMLASRRSADYRLNQRNKALGRWQDPEYVSKQDAFKYNRSADNLAKLRQLQPKVSCIQALLYSILNDLGVQYFRERNDGLDDKECTIGPYSFDCVIPRNGKPSLLIECQGEYWHNLDKNRSRDAAKASYIANNLSDDYELKVIWEHEFYDYLKVVELLKYWLDITEYEIVEYSLDDVVVDKCQAEQYRNLLQKYHYLTTAGRGGLPYGAFLNNELIAVCVFSTLMRQNLPYDINSTLELSRFCIHPKFRRKNLASWLISRCIKQLPVKYKTIIAYSDETFNHIGTIYKASNFRFDQYTKPDFWYIGSDGWVMHKKTLYNRAIKMSMKESEYAEINGYNKVYGKRKLRYSFCR